MQKVGVRELKAHLSAYLRRTETGERLTVTDRGRAVAVLSPIESTRVDWVHGLVSEGLARWGGGKPVGLTPRIKSRGKPASQMVIDDRR